MPRIFACLCVLLIAVPLALSASSFAPRAINLSESDGQRSLRVSHHGDFPLRVLSAIEDGLRVQVVTEVVIRRRASFFLSRDALITNPEYSRSVRYNLIERRYSIRDDKSGELVYFSSRSSLLYALAAEVEIPLAGSAQFSDGMTYYAEARVVIRMGRLYPPFSFLPILSYSSPWIRSANFTPQGISESPGGRAP